MAARAKSQRLEKSARYFRAKLLGWSLENYREFPWRNTSDPYRICVAEIMLQQTFARKVSPVYESFIKRYPSVQALTKARVADLRKLISPLGFLYRAGRFKKMAGVVIKKFGGTFPKDLDGLRLLPGVGKYTASAIQCFAYQQEVPIIDVNVVRIYSRFFGISVVLPRSNPNTAISAVAEMVISGGKARQLNYALLDFAFAVCSHYQPKHELCPLKRKCARAQ